MVFIKPKQGQRIKAFCTERGIKLSAVAEELEIASSHLSTMIHGQMNISPKYLFTLNKYQQFDCQLNFLKDFYEPYVQEIREINLKISELEIIVDPTQAKWRELYEIHVQELGRTYMKATPAIKADIVDTFKRLQDQYRKTSE